MKQAMIRGSRRVAALVLLAAMLFALPAQGLATEVGMPISDIFPITLTPGDGKITVRADDTAGFIGSKLLLVASDVVYSPVGGSWIEPSFVGTSAFEYTLGQDYDLSVNNHGNPLVNGTTYYVYLFLTGALTGGQYVINAYGHGTATPETAPAAQPAAQTADPAVQVYVPANYQKGMIINCNEWVSVRIAPEAGSEVLGRVYLGEIVELMKWDSPSENWCWVSYNGGMNGGWVDGRYIQGY